MIRAGAPSVAPPKPASSGVGAAVAAGARAATAPAPAPARTPARTVGPAVAVGARTAAPAQVVRLPQKAPSGPSPLAWVQHLMQATGALQKLAGVPLLNIHPGFQGYLNPFPGAILGRTDMGVDLNLKPGDPILAMGKSKVLGISPNWYAGQPYVGMKLLDGPQKGRVWYVAEQIAPAVAPGQVVKRGQVVGTYASNGTGIEAGWASPADWRQTLAQAQGNTGDASHNNAPAGINFRSFLGNLKAGKPTTGMAASPAAAVASGPQSKYAAAVLRGIGAPVTPGNVAAFRGWAVAEGGDNWARNNPLNTTESAGASATINSAGVRAYPSPAAGVAATVKTLKNGNYGGIVGAFQHNQPSAVGPAVASSPWGTGAAAIQTINQALGGSIPAASSSYTPPTGSSSTGAAAAASGALPSAVSSLAGMPAASGVGQSGQAGLNAARLSAILKLLQSTTADIGGGPNIDTGPSALGSLFATGLVGGMPSVGSTPLPAVHRGRAGGRRRRG